MTGYRSPQPAFPRTSTEALVYVCPMLTLHTAATYRPVELIRKGAQLRPLNNAETGTEYSMSVLPESARALGLPQDNMAEVAFSLLPYSSISLTAVRPSSELGISPERHAQAHTIAVMQ